MGKSAGKRLPALRSMCSGGSIDCLCGFQSGAGASSGILPVGRWIRKWGGFSPPGPQPRLRNSIPNFGPHGQAGFAKSQIGCWKIPQRAETQRMFVDERIIRSYRHISPLLPFRPASLLSVGDAILTLFCQRVLLPQRVQMVGWTTSSGAKCPQNGLSRGCVPNHTERRKGRKFWHGRSDSGLP